MKRLGMTADLWWLTASLGLRGLGHGLYMMLWPLYVEQLGGTAVGLGLLSAIGPLATAAVLLPGGLWADRGDRRRLAIWGAWLAVPAPLLFAWAPGWAWLIPGLLLFYGATFSRPALQAMVAEQAPPARMAVAYGLVMSAFDAGMILGPPLGAFLLHSWGSFRPLFLCSSGLYAVAALLLGLLRRPLPSRFHRRLLSWVPTRRPTYFRWLAFAAGFTGVQSLAIPFVVPYWKAVGGMSVETIGWLGALGILAATLFGPAWGLLAQRWGYARAVGVGAALNAAGWAAMLWRPTSIGWNLGAVALRATEEGCTTVAGSAVGRAVAPEEAGTAYGVFNLAVELARAAGPLPGAWAYQATVFGPFALSALLTAALAWALLDGWADRPAR